ncbi:phage associated protein [Neisseria gonorrhoeae]|uniref:Phage associated protein n=1 Tax=Neisseria gonorrhoeae TaxID=485 RepID=A0A378VXI5_NEIGO|nr:phage associated protein [Neisseria gonorrhoeae]
MNKPFITQAQLALYKYQPSSEYFGQSMAFIAQKEFEEFVNNVKEYDILESFSYFLNKRVAHNIWKIYFLMSLLFYKKIRRERKNCS